MGLGDFRARTDLIRRMGKGLCWCPSLDLLMGTQALPILPLVFGSDIFCFRKSPESAPVDLTYPKQWPWPSPTNPLGDWWLGAIG
jgi:hypothetical protein